MRMKAYVCCGLYSGNIHVTTSAPPEGDTISALLGITEIEIDDSYQDRVDVNLAEIVAAHNKKLNQEELERTKQKLKLLEEQINE